MLSYPGDHQDVAAPDPGHRRASSGRARLAPDAFSSKMTAQPAARRSSSWLKVA